MSRESMVWLSLTGLHVTWVLLPLIPAILIYWLFPSTAVAVSGPLSGLTVKAGGAFGAYLIVFAASYPLVQGHQATIGGFQRPFWTINGKIVMIDKDGAPVQSNLLWDKVEMKTRPQLFAVQSNYLRVSIPEEGDDLPLLILHIPNVGEGTIDLRDLKSKSDVIVDQYHKTIQLKNPFEIRAYATGSGLMPTSAVRPQKPQKDYDADVK